MVFVVTRLYLQLARSEDCVETVGGGHNLERVDEASATEQDDRPVAQCNNNHVISGTSFDPILLSRSVDCDCMISIVCPIKSHTGSTNHAPVQTDSKASQEAHGRIWKDSIVEKAYGTIWKPLEAIGNSKNDLARQTVGLKETVRRRMGE